MSKVIKVFLFLLIIVSSCKLDDYSPPVSDMAFVDYTETEKIYNGQEGLLDFGERLVPPLGDRSIKPLGIKNSGSGDLVITNISIVNITGEGFYFLDGIKPDFPLVIPEGKTVNDIFIEFIPADGMAYSGAVYVETEAGSSYLDLAGTGLWQLTLTVAAGEFGKITSPIEVLPGQSLTTTSSSSIFNLGCELVFLNEFVEWSAVVGPDATAPVFDNDDYISKETVVELKSHTEISMVIRNPFVRVPDDFQSIQDAIIACRDNTNGGLEEIAVIVRQGTYTQSFTLAVNVPVYGGYKTDVDWESREYKTNADRNLDDYKTEIIGSITSGSGIGSNVILEGFVINGNVSFSSGTGAVLQYNTITGTGDNPAVTIDNASNLIQNNVINGAVTSGDYSKTYGIKVIEGSKPVIYKNTINGGTSGGTGSQAFGIFNNFECEPLITGNTIFGGTASGTDGQSYGIYMINNGKVTAGYNNINGGAGKTAYALYAAYGGNLYLDFNNIFTSGSSSVRNGVYAGTQGRIRSLLNNGIYDCPDSLIHTSLPGEDVTDIDDVNDIFYTDTNTDSVISFTIPDSPYYE